MKPHRSRLARLFLLVLFAFVSTTAAQTAAEQEGGLGGGRPNIVLMVADDLGYGDLSVYGATKLDTPRIDQLASEGIRLTNAFASAAVCQPSRYALLTGRYDWRRGKRFDGKSVFAPGEDNLATILQADGYRTACMGKWHLGFGTGPINYNRKVQGGPIEVGFDYFFGTPRSHNEPPFVFVENDRVYQHEFKDKIKIIPSKKARELGLPDWGWGSSIGGERAHAARPEEKIDLIIAERAAAFIRKQDAENPFFLYLPFVAPHVPVSPDSQFSGTSGAGDYGDFIHQLDHSVGDVLAALDEAGLAENTIVIFTSDNGAVYMPGAVAHGHQSTGPFLGQKTDAWEGGSRVPFIVRWPGRIPDRTVSDAVFSLTDIVATLLAAVEVAMPDGAGEDSIDQLPHFRNPDDAKNLRHEMIYTGIFGKGLRQGEWVYYPFQGSGGMTAHPEQRWGQTYERIGFKNSDHHSDGTLKADVPAAQLYHVADDPVQSKNVFAQHPEQAQAMHERLAGLLGTDLPMPGANVE